MGWGSEHNTHFLLLVEELDGPEVSVVKVEIVFLFVCDKLGLDFDLSLE